MRRDGAAGAWLRAGLCVVSPYGSTVGVGRPWRFVDLHKRAGLQAIVLFDGMTLFARRMMTKGRDAIVQTTRRQDFVSRRRVGNLS